jgi:small subunit ribosomal protein S15
MISTAKKADLIKKHQASKTDTGSPQVQATIMTARIAEITEHLKVNKHDNMARRGLLQLVGKRRRQLQYLASKDGQAYLDLIAKLGIRR